MPSTVQLARRITDVRQAVAQARAAGRKIALVPTMGALHAGHVSLIDSARRSGAFVLVSIYVNPTQFGPGEDFADYPRDLDADMEVCRQAGVDLVFAPPHDEIYPPGDETRVRPGLLASALCGPFRPGHFEGVCTVVAKLFHIVAPDTAYFGRKDAQQVVIIRRMVRDLRLPIEVVVCPLVREPDGLALSSRNARLNPKDRQRALALYSALAAGEARLRAGERSFGKVVAAMRAVIASHPEISVEYLSIVDPDTLEPATPAASRVLIAGAVRIGGVRLIDNMLVEHVVDERAGGA